MSEQNKVKYKNPPVVEVASICGFNLSNESPQWNKELGDKFIEQFPEFKIRNYGNRMGQIRDDYTAEQIGEVWGRSDDMSRSLTVAKNYVRCHRSRDRHIYPRYSDVREMVCQYVAEYQKYLKADIIKSVGLLYLDVISIPTVDFKFNEYFQFGFYYDKGVHERLSNFYIGLDFNSKEEYGIDLNLRISQLPKGANETSNTLQLNWFCMKNIRDTSNYIVELDDVHTFLLDMFENNLTDKCKKLFN
ncbi:MAG: TIGR04255 family protein [Planctomycetaceae bacterium]|jgi:uncharacterized protein (TIGR04255 family)|nr:TIGR04255 family protein [Planctomycetaceae bacterium]